MEQPKPEPSLKSILLEQLKSTHSHKEWFVSINDALEGLTAEQANWSDGANHSIGQLVHHLLYWNERVLAKYKGQPKEKFDGDNNRTFSSFDSSNWELVKKNLSEVLLDWEMIVENTDEETLKPWYSTIAHIGTHNAYHTGQIIHIRKQQGLWQAGRGVL